MKKIFYFICLFLFALIITAQTEVKLRQKITKIISTKKASFGIAIYNFKDQKKIYFNKKKKFVLMSVVKFPQAIAILDKVDKGKLNINKKIYFGKKDLLKNTYSPIIKDKKRDNFSISLDEALSYTVSKSDNNVCDKLFKILGGSNEAEKYFKKIGYKSLTIGTDYANMGKNTIYANQINPEEMLNILIKFYNNELLSKKNTALLWNKLTETVTGPDRIKGLLPEGIIVGHKTGTSNTDKNGITPAFNDIGIVKLPDGNSFAIVVFISNSKENHKTNAKTIAKITKVTYDFLK